MATMADELSRDHGGQARDGGTTTTPGAIIG